MTISFSSFYSPEMQFIRIIREHNAKGLHAVSETIAARLLGMLDCVEIIDPTRQSLRKIAAETRFDIERQAKIVRPE